MTLGRRIITVGTGTALAQIATALSTPVLTRLFAPEAHAAWAIYMSICLILSGIATLRYELAVVLPGERSTAAALVLGGTIFAVLISVLSVPVLWLVGGHFLPVDQQGNLWLWCALVPVSVFSTAIFQLGVAWCTREIRFKAYSIAQFSLPVGMLAGQLASGLAGHRTASGLIAGTVCGQFAVAVILAIHVWLRNSPVFHASANSREISQAVGAYRQYPLFMTPYTLVGMTRDRLAYFLLGRFGTSADAGFYGLVSRFVNLPNSFIASAVRPVFFQHAAGREPHTLEEPVRETMRGIGIIGVLVWAPCVPHAAWLCGLLFGPAWQAAAPYAIALSIPAIPLAMGNWADRMFDILGRQRLALIMELIFSGLAMLGLVGGYLVFHDLLWAIWVQSLLLTLYYFGWMVLLFRVAGFGTGRLLRAIGGILVLGAGAWFACWAAAQLLPPPVAFPITASTAGMIAAWQARRQWAQLRATSPGRP